MDAAKMLNALAASGLEGPTTIEESLVDTAHMAEVVALGVTSDELDPDAEAAIGFFVRRLRSTFVAPALATESHDQFIELWSEECGPALRLMDAVFLCLYETQRASSGDRDVLARRLEHSDRRVIHESAKTLEEHLDASLASDLRRALALVEMARDAFRQPPDDPDPDLIRLFHRGLLIWALGNHLSIALAERSSSLVKDAILRPDLGNDIISFVNDGARMAGFFATFMVGLSIVGDPSADALESFRCTPFVAFLLRATIEIKRVFGRDVRVALTQFVYPDEPDAWELHVVIDSPMEPHLAGDALDRLCEEWWDAGVADLDIEVHPVLGTLDHG